MNNEQRTMNCFSNRKLVLSAAEWIENVFVIPTEATSSRKPAFSAPPLDYHRT
jgi:hypothetical protein